MKDEIQKVTFGTNEALRVTADGEFIWHPEADAMIEEGDFTSSPAMRHILRALRKALAAPVQDEFDIRGMLASKLTCWNRLRETEANELVALVASLSQTAPVQEPVAWMFQHDETGRMNYVGNDGIHNPTMFLEMNPRYALVCPLYTTPPAAQRQWQGLTDKEIEKACVPLGSAMLSFAEVARAIEAKLKEKNT
jgi:hypothetical protein